MAKVVHGADIFGAGERLCCPFVNPNGYSRRIKLSQAGKATWLFSSSRELNGYQATSDIANRLQAGIMNNEETLH